MKDSDDNGLTTQLRALVRETCHTPLMHGSFIAVDEQQLREYDAKSGTFLRRTVATPDELITALRGQIGLVNMANGYLRQLRTEEMANGAPPVVLPGDEELRAILDAAIALALSANRPQAPLQGALVDAVVEAVIAAGLVKA
jgi:hypothetical protein